MQNRSFMLFFCPLGFVWPVASLKSQQWSTGTAKGQSHIDSTRSRAVLFVLPVIKSHHPPSPGLVCTLQWSSYSLNLCSDKPGSTRVSHTVQMRSVPVLLEQELSSLPWPCGNTALIAGGWTQTQTLLRKRAKS